MEEEKEIVGKIEKILFQSIDDKNKHIDYILYDSEEKMYFVLASDGYEDIIGITLQNENETYFHIPEWDYNFDNYLFQKLKNGYKIEYMTNDTHYGLWNSINELYPDDIENKEGVQNYLQYCFDEGITKEYLDKKMKVDTPDISQYFDGLTINQTMEYKGYIIEVGELNYDNPNENLLYIYDNLENYMNGDERETISLTTIGLKKNIRDYINDTYFDNEKLESEKAYFTFVLGYDLLNDMLSKSSTKENDVCYDFCNMLAGEFLKSENYKNEKNSSYEILEKWVNENKEYIKKQHNLFTEKNKKSLNESSIKNKKDERSR